MERLKLDIQRFGASVSLTASETAVDETAIQNNQTYINLSIRVQTTKPTWNGNKTAYYQVTTTSQNEGTQTGGKYYFSIGSSTGSGDKTFTTTLGPFTHNPDGTLNNVSISTYVKITDSTNRTATKSVAMATIPRASQPTISANPTLGSQITIYTNRVSSSFTHTITYTFGSASGTIGTGVGASVNWTPAITLAQQIPNATTGTGTITCYTYNGGTLVGTKSVGFTATVPGSIVPSISLSNPTIGGSAPAGWGIFVKGKSTASYTITGTGNQGSTISQYQSSVAGYSYTTASVTTGILYSAGTQTISAKVIDSRGRQATTSKTFNVVDYYNPSFTAVQIQRVDQNGNLDDNGEFAYFHFAGSVSSCSGNNKGTFKIAYREHNTGSYTEKTIATNQESINQSGFITSDGTQSGTKIEFENTKTYDIKFMITDTFITVENLQQLDTGFDLMNFNPSGKSMAIGKVSEAGANEELFEMGLPFKIVDGIKYVELTNENILQLKPGYYFKEGSTGWGENNWPIATWHATLKVSGTAYDNNNGYRILEVMTTDNRVYKRTQSWDSWSGWEQINNNLAYINHGDNLDNFQDTGYYLGNQTNNISNSPDGNTTIDGLLVVERVGSDLFFAIQTFYYSNGFIYKRMSWFGAYWTSWKKIDN